MGSLAVLAIVVAVKAGDLGGWMYIRCWEFFLVWMVLYGLKGLKGVRSIENAAHADSILLANKYRGVEHLLVKNRMRNPIQLITSRNPVESNVNYPTN